MFPQAIIQAGGSPIDSGLMDDEKRKVIADQEKADAIRASTGSVPVPALERRCCEFYMVDHEIYKGTYIPSHNEWSTHGYSGNYALFVQLTKEGVDKKIADEEDFKSHQMEKFVNEHDLLPQSITHPRHMLGLGLDPQMAVKKEISSVSDVIEFVDDES